MKKFLKVLAMIILVPIFFGATLTLLLLVPLRNTVTNNVMKEMISSLEIEKEVENNPQFKQVIDKTLEPVYDVTREVGIDDEIIIKVLDIQEVKDLIGDISNNVFNAAITGVEQKLITTDNITSIIGKAIDDINNSGLYEIKEETKNEIIDVVNEEASEIQETVPDTSVVLKELGSKEQKLIKIVRFILSKKFLWYVIGCLGISFIAILLLNLKHLKWIKQGAIIGLVASIFSIIITAIASVLNNMYLKVDYNFIFKVITKFINSSYIISGSLLAFLIITLIVYHILRKKEVI